MEYVGPAAGPALTSDGWTVFCHDDSFTSREVRERFEQTNPGHFAAEATDAVSFAEEGLRRFGKIDCLISNEIPKQISYSMDITALSEIEDLLLDAEAYIESLLVTPMRLVRSVLPTMKSAGMGSIIFITSGAPLRNPAIRLPHGYIAGRAGVNAAVKGLAVELAPLGIQVNAIAPFFIFSRNGFPSPLGAEDPRIKAIVNSVVPAQRVGRWDEIAPLITLLASGKAGFVSGQIIAFSGAGC
jgi:NAD(P)-dependent dehydrogenase (short-subunit alcohol dehydrogenase family)